MVPLAVPPAKLKKLSISIAFAVAPVIMVGSVANGKAVAPQVELTTHVGLVQLSAPITTLTVLFAVVVPFALVAE